MENFKEKLNSVKEEIKAKAKKAVKTAKNGAEWCVEHKDVVVPVVLGAGTAIGGIGKFLGGLEKRRAVNKEVRRQERTIYNHSTGHYIELKRPLSAKQTLELERRRSMGEPLSIILDDMRMLRK